jgi:hypothetical protein
MSLYFFLQRTRVIWADRGEAETHQRGSQAQEVEKPEPQSTKDAPVFCSFGFGRIEESADPAGILLQLLPYFLSHRRVISEPADVTLGSCEKDLPEVLQRTS